ncbi:putative pentatricopeptide repeat-containing protein isoform X1 [Cinnamomum micranthum f. kanehirae]|uniref:Putative pentatricopeptide repeat-containing protein isoform X1 n=1 Tax=Cinnamomum micranthum f. kanehirae TaxID=337451 RepID=A0A3S3NRF8_9MAGN|nr:putative pentatricopeptide repeat-containing protein isoform X1 [Cinnamomum micranthum f. kanehirae]
MTSSCSRNSSREAWKWCMSLAERCTNMRQLKAIHAIFITHGLHHNNYALSKLISFSALSPSGSLPYATLLFLHSPSPPNSFIFNTLIRSHAPRHPSAALRLFLSMLRHHPHLRPDHHTFPFALSACANLPSLVSGLQLHSTLLKNGLAASDPLVQAALLRMYAQTSSLPDARRLFDEIPHRDRDPTLWNILINGYLRFGDASEAVRLFGEMVASDVAPDCFCVATGVAACAHLGALQQGAWIHEYAKRHGFMADVFIGTSLVDLYSKCGCLDRALEVFDEMPSRNVFSWAAMVGGFAMHGFAKEALHCLERIEEEDGLRPDGVVLLGVLTACSHAGLEEEGRRLLTNMEREYGVAPKHEHYSCMVDLLCRAGRLYEALELVREMPMRPLASVWGTMLSGSRIHGNVELAELAADELLKLEGDGIVEEDDGVYVQLSNVYLSARRREDARRVRKMMGSRGIKKTPGCSVIEVDGKANEFVVGDEAHPLRLHIQSMLKLLYHNIIHLSELGNQLEPYMV